MSLFSLLPGGSGYLPHWQLLVATTAIINSVSNFKNPQAARLVYNSAPREDGTYSVFSTEGYTDVRFLTPVSALQARTFAMWTLTSGMVRAFSAYSLDHPVVYKMTFLTYAFAFLHFASECLVFRTAKLSAATISPFIVSSVSMIWMWQQYDFYTVA